MQMRLFAVIAAAVIADDGSQWIEIIPVATEVRNGRWFFTITRADLDTYAESIKTNAGLIPIDYDHEGSSGGSTVAAGWFTGDTQIVETDGLTPTGDTQAYTSLWAKVKWTPQAMQEIRDGRFKRISAEFDFKERDTKTGLLTKAKEIIAATLTNRPFFRQLAPVATQGDVVWDSNLGFAWLQDQVSAAINPAGPDCRYWVMDVAPGAALIRDCNSAQSWVAPIEIDGDHVNVAPAADWVEARQEWVAASVAALDANRAARPSTEKGHDMDTKVFAKSLGLPDDATDDQITEAVTAAKAAADELATVKTELDELKAAAGDKTEVDKLREELETEKTLRLTDKRDTLLARAVVERRIDPAVKDVLAEQFGTNIDGIEKILATYTPKPGQAQGTGGPGRDDGADLDTDAARAADMFEIHNDGRKVTAIEEELDLHVKAEKILTDRGKPRGEYTSQEYVAALDEAARTVPAAA